MTARLTNMFSSDFFLLYMDVLSPTQAHVCVYLGENRRNIKAFLVFDEETHTSGNVAASNVDFRVVPMLPWWGWLVDDPRFYLLITPVKRLKR